MTLRICTVLKKETEKSCSVLATPIVRIVWEVAWTFLQRVFQAKYVIFSVANTKIRLEEKDHRILYLEKNLRSYLPTMLSLVTKWNFKPFLKDNPPSAEEIWLTPLWCGISLLLLKYGRHSPWKLVKFYLGAIPTIRLVIKTRNKDHIDRLGRKQLIKNYYWAAWVAQ